MKKSLGAILVIIVVAILIGTFIASKSSIAEEKAKDGRFIAYNNGTVLDTKTNLMWAAKDSGNFITWQEAKYFCKNYRVGGYDDWRLPTLKELAALYDETKSYASDCGDGKDLHLTELIRLRCGWIWSSKADLSNGYYFLFYDGTDHQVSMTDFSYNLHVLPVRSGK